ncbi:MAG TPA: hypothetical protein VFT65_08050 [Candidatus Angelobacter sp.]|nr:hypothetical protein [Candidatus Angelobacter sp.]
MPEKDDMKARLARKSEEVSSAILTIVADVIMLVVWLAVESGFEHYVTPRFPVETYISRAVFLVFRVLVALSTLAIPGIYTYEDIRTMLLKSRARIRMVAKMEAAAAQEIPEKTGQEGAIQ